MIVVWPALVGREWLSWCLNDECATDGARFMKEPMHLVCNRVWENEIFNAYVHVFTFKAVDQLSI